MGDPEAETRIQSGSSRLGARPLGQVDQIGPYAILGELGRGGMGAVYRCRHPHLQREVAIKVLLAGEHAGQKQVERFRREAEAAASLRHPNITAVHDVGQDQGRPFIVMDLIEGVSLQDRIEQGPLAPAEAARLTLALARALAYAHSQGILHRDVKPSNVLITPEGEPLLTDFGLAKRVDTAEQGGITVTGQFLGTPGFMPPEQARGQGDRVDRRADVYALGATLYAMLAGDHPFADLTGVAVLGATIDQQPPSLLHARADLPRDLETICFTCLEKEPGDRYPSALDLADDLERYLKDEPIQAQPATSFDRLRKWTRRNRALALVSVSALVVVLAGGLGVGLWTIRARAQAAVAEERARHDAAAEQRRGLAEAARREVATLSAEQPASSGERIGRALAQLQAAQRWLVLTPDDPDARRAQFDAALTLGDLALETEQWGLARQAFEQMRGLGVGDAQASARIARVTEEREADERRRREEIETLLVRAEGGTLTARLGALDDALFTIVRRAGRGTVAQLTGRLDEISAALRAAELAIYKEGTRGQELTGLEAALAARARVGTEALPTATRTLLKRADERLERQLKGLQIRPEARMLVAAGQASRLGAGPLTLAELICRGLGRLGRAEATASLGRYLAAEADGLRAVHAGRALARLGGAEAQLHLMRSFTRFGPLSLYSRRVAPLFALLPAAPPQVRAGEASTYLRRARYHDLRGEHVAAAKDCDEALRLKPTSTAALSLRALARGAQKDFPAALRDLDRAIELDPDDPLLLCKRAEVRMILGQERWAGARQDIERAIQLDPTVSDPWSLRGRLRDRTGDLDGAENDFGLAIARDPREAGVLVNRGILRSRRGDHARAFTDLTRALSLNPSMSTAWSNRAVIRRRMGDIAGAEDDYGQALRLDPGLANAWMNRGHLRQLRGDMDGAVRDYEECLRRNPTQRDAKRALVLAREQRRAVEAAKGPHDAPNWLRAGEQMLRKGAKDRAFLAFSIAIRIDPTLAAAWAARGDMHARAGENTLALRDYERALELEPMRASAWVNRGAARFAMEQLKDARLDFDQALRLDPRQPLPWYNRGVLRYEQGDLRGAERDLSECLKRRPTMVQALVWRGVVRRWLGNLKGGRQDLEQILKRNPRHDGALAYRAMIRLEEGDPAGALADANQALKTNRRASPAWLARGVVLARQPAQKRAALVALENSLRLGITGLDAQLARSTLAELGAR